MKILSYIIPKELQNNQFMKSLYGQFTQTGKLSPRQVNALKDMLDIEEDFYEWDYECRNTNECAGEYSDLKTKLARNRFKTVKGKNRCIRAMQSIINGTPNRALIDEALGLYYRPGRGWR